MVLINHLDLDFTSVNHSKSCIIR